MEHKVWAYSRRSFGSKAAYPAGWTQARVDEIWTNLNIVIVGGGGRRQSPSDARNVETGGALPPPEAIYRLSIWKIQTLTSFFFNFPYRLIYNSAHCGQFADHR